MKPIFHTIAIILFCNFLFSSCKKEDIAGYSNDSRLFLQIPGSGSIKLRDSLIYSFPAKPNVGAEDTLWFKACIMGMPASVDRSIALKVNAGLTTAVENVNYRLVLKPVPADSYSVMIPLVVYRQGLKDTSVRLEMEVVENENFKIGFERYKRVVFIWGDKFLKPDIWDISNYKNAFGSFSSTRYEFILKACNITELPDPMNLEMLGYYNAVVRKALLDYNSTAGNTPLADELGPVSFPIYTGVGGNG